MRNGIFLFSLFHFLFAAGCKRDDMADQARFKPLAPSSFYANGASARQAVDNTVARDDSLVPETGAWGGGEAFTRVPFEVTSADLVRGQERFQIYCAPCHGILGDGEGMIPQRGFTRPPSYHTERLRAAPLGYFYDVMTKGIGAMYPYRAVIPQDDRWRIAAYVRALQISQQTATATGGGQ
jgi:mono/diheme cytochrome c family protein